MVAANAYVIPVHTSSACKLSLSIYKINKTVINYIHKKPVRKKTKFINSIDVFEILVNAMHSGRSGR